MTLVPRTTATKREILREREQKSRQRRAAKLATMRARMDELEVAALVLRTVDDDDAVWDGFLDEKIVRVRHFVRQHLVLTNEASTLTHEHTQLHRLLQEHQLLTQVITNSIADMSLDDWDRKIHRWRDIAQKYYEPWTMDACQEEMDASLSEVNAFQWSTDKQTTGLSYLGWREARRVDRVRGRFQCEFSKTLRGYEMMDYVNVAWDAYTDAQSYYDIILGPTTRAYLEVMQQLTPNVIIVQTTELYPVMDVDIHNLYLVFRVRTENGFQQFVRSICSPALMNEIDEPRDMWPANFIWMQFEQHFDEEQTYTVRFGGRLGDIDINYARMKMIGALGSVLRSEIRATGRKLVISN